MTALVDPPSAMTTLTAFSNERRSRKFCGRWSSQTISTMRRPEFDAIRTWLESAAGIEAAPGSVIPSASAALVIVEAVPMVMQWPGERAIDSAMSCHCASVMLPARSSSQYFKLSLPLPRILPRQWALSIGPAGTKMHGSPMLNAPIRSPGVVLSQPPIRTAPSIGWARSTSSVSIARRLR